MADTGTPEDTTGTGTGKGAPASNRSSRKRKADELSDDETEETPPHLPAPVWGHVLDYMPYGEVRSALLVGKLIAVEAVQYVQTLNIMRECELYVPAARRFGNVEEVNILCLLERTGEENMFGRDFFSISLGVSSRAVPFFGSFAKLGRGFVGGLDSDGRRFTYNSYCVRGRQGGDLYRSLLTAYVGAIRSGVLSREAVLKGIDLWHLSHSLCREKSSNCQWCRDILLHFPLNEVLDFWVDNETDFFCQTEQEQWDIVRRRPDMDEGLSELSEDVLCRQVSNILYDVEVKNQFRAAAIEHLPEKWRRSERWCKELWVYSISQSDLQKLDELIEKGFDPKCVTRKFAMEMWEFCIGSDGRTFHTWTRTTVESLAARGFPVDCDCVPVIDDKYNVRQVQR